MLDPITQHILKKQNLTELSIAGSYIPNQVVITGVGISIYLIMAAYKVYQKHLSQSARACKDKTSKTAKALCMKQYKREAGKKQIKALMKFKSQCKNETKYKCIAKLDQEINKVKSKKFMR